MFKKITLGEKVSKILKSAASQIMGMVANEMLTSLTVA